MGEGEERTNEKKGARKTEREVIEQGWSKTGSGHAVCISSNRKGWKTIAR